MKKALFIGFVFIFLLICTAAMAQDAMIIAGPFGHPLMVLEDDGQNYCHAIKVYSDDEIESFITDVTTPGWIAWHGPLFHEKGIYEVALYTHFIKPSYCMRVLCPPGSGTDHDRQQMCSWLRYWRRRIAVDTRQNTVMVLDLMQMDSKGWYHPDAFQKVYKTYSLPNGVKPPLAKAIARITAIIKEEAGQGRD
jgi:hypothetical protein